MFPRARVFSFALAAFFLLTSFAWTQDLPIRRSFGQGSLSTLTVTVRDSANQPIADARVEVRPVMSIGNSVSGYTNRSGIFEATGMSDGAYEIVAQKGVTQTTERVELGAGLMTLSIRLENTAPDAAEIGDRATVSLGQYKVPKKAREEYKKAESALSDRKLDESHKHLAKALEIYPDFAEALTMRGIVNLEAKNFDAAISDLDHAIKSDSGYSMSYIAMGAAYNMTQRFDDALRVLDRGVSLAPQSWQAYFEVSKAQIGKSNYEAAIRAADKAQALSDGRYPLVHLLKAHAMLALKQYDPAMGELQAFIDQAPKAPEAEGARTTLEQVRAFVAKQ
jgi:lipopolysaccharide biosynthesis regulator YciM